MHPCKFEFRSPNKLRYIHGNIYVWNEWENIEKIFAFDMNTSIFFVVCILLLSTIGWKWIIFFFYFKKVFLLVTTNIKSRGIQNLIISLIYEF